MKTFNDKHIGKHYVKLTADTSAWRNQGFTGWSSKFVYSWLCKQSQHSLDSAAQCFWKYAISLKNWYTEGENLAKLHTLNINGGTEMGFERINCIFVDFLGWPAK